MRRVVLLLSGLVLVCVPASPISAQDVTALSAVPGDRYADYVREAASRFGVPAHWIDAVMQAESRGDANATSVKGAMGLMQIMPRTWAGLRVRYGLGANPYDPRDNVLAGTAYLRELYDRYGFDGFLAAYNAGPDRYENSLAMGRALPAETVAYVERVTQAIGQKPSDRSIVVASLSPSRAASPLFAVRCNDDPAASTSAAGLQNERKVSAHDPQRRFVLAPQSAGMFVPTTRKAASP
jgi:hypothetical protein